jgi:hypothetical protein
LKDAHFLDHPENPHAGLQIVSTIQMPFENPQMRNNIATISLFYQLKSVSRCFACLETKLNVHSLLYHNELSQWSAR